jgi:hypothetical protein
MWLLAGLLVLLAACGRSAPAVTSVVLPEGWQTVQDEEVTFALPPEWEALSTEDSDFAGAIDELVRENPGLQGVAGQAQTAVATGQISLIAFDLAPEHMLPNFTSNLSLGRQPLDQPASLEQVLEENERALRANGFVDVRRATMQVAGEDAARLSSVLEITDAGGAPLTLAVEQAIIARPQRQYVLTFTTAAEQKERMLPVFEQIMGTFRIALTP